MGFIYLVRNTINGKIYVGQTRLSVVAQRWRSHLKAANGTRSAMVLHQAIRKYGAAAFAVSVLAELNEQNALDELERFWILGLRSIDQHIGYNRDIARVGPRHTAETRAKISATRLARKIKHSPAARAKMSASRRGQAHPWSKGKPLSPVHVAHLIAAKSTPEYHTKTSAAHRGCGHPHTLEHRIAMRGDGNPARTEQTRAKLRAAWERRRGTI